MTPTTRLLAVGLGALCIAAPAFSQTEARDLASLKKAAFTIDKHVATLYKRKKLPVPKVVDDPTFLRRSFLVSTGRIPTLEEARMFLEIDDANKREMLAGYLMKSDGYRSSMVNWVSDLIRLTDNFNQGQAAPYVEFVHNAMTSNMRWDDFAKTLLSAKGSGWEDNNGAVGYFIRDKGMELDNLSNTMRIFTGERMECAQCHDSPFNKWERMDFYELAAFTAGQGEMNRGPWNSVWRQVRDAKEERSEFGRLVDWLGDNVHYFTLAGGGMGRIKLPRDYQYRDGDPGEMIGGKTHFGKRIRSSDRRDDQTARKDFADWMVSKENDNFTSVIVNRMWKRIMGKGIYEPVDEYKPADKTITPDLMEYLVRLMRDDLQYDLRAFQHVLLLSKNFQFAANPQAFEAGMPQAFNGRQIERMSAEQVWDSLVTLTKGNPDNLPKRKFSNTIFYRGQPVLVGEKTMSQLSRELLAIKKPGEYRTYVNDLLQKIKSGGGGKKKAMMSMEAMQRPGPASGMARASELPAPAPAGHPLRMFGSSDRDLIDSATREPNMAQVLSIMNGWVEKNVVSNSGSAAYKAIEAGSTDRDKVRFLYYSILSRPPSDQEMTLLMRDVIDGSIDSYKNLLSALISSHEFIFVQ